jgi:hypothetical protein
MKEVILQDKNTEKYYRYYFSRAGSYFTEYFYDIDNVDEVELEEVEPVELVITGWKKVE